MRDEEFASECRAAADECRAEFAAARVSMARAYFWGQCTLGAVSSACIAVIAWLALGWAFAALAVSAGFAGVMALSVFLTRDAAGDREGGG